MTNNTCFFKKYLLQFLKFRNSMKKYYAIINPLLLLKDGQMLYLDNRFMEVALPIIEHEKYQQMRYIKHHDESVFEHSVKVAFYAYQIAYKRNLDWRATIRGALLHDFFLYKFKKYFQKGVDICISL